MFLCFKRLVLALFYLFEKIGVGFVKNAHRRFAILDFYFFLR